jgi:hypothetical protein
MLTTRASGDQAAAQFPEDQAAWPEQKSLHDHSAGTPLRICSWPGDVCLQHDVVGMMCTKELI